MRVRLRGSVGVITRTAHYESCTTNGAGYSVWITPEQQPAIAAAVVVAPLALVVHVLAAGHRRTPVVMGVALKPEAAEPAAGTGLALRNLA